MDKYKFFTEVYHTIPKGSILVLEPSSIKFDSRMIENSKTNTSECFIKS